MRIGLAGGAGTVNLNGGAITAPAITQGSGTATFNFNSGVLHASGNSSAFMQGLSRANIRAGGAIIDTNGFNATIAQPLLHSNIAGDEITDGGLTKLGNGTLTLTASNTYTGITTITGGTLVLKGSGAQTPVLTGGGADLKSGKLILDYTGGSDPVTSGNLRTILASAYSSNFTSGQIHSSNVQDIRKGIGYIDNTGSSQVSMMYTYYGDLNLDGQVSTADFTTLATSFNQSGTWQQGDFNYDGKVNALDFNALASNFGATPISMSMPLPGALVPEPTSLIGIALGAFMTRRRERRRHPLIADDSSRCSVLRRRFFEEFVKGLAEPTGMRETAFLGDSRNRVFRCRQQQLCPCQMSSANGLQGSTTQRLVEATFQRARVSVPALTTSSTVTSRWAFARMNCIALRISGSATATASVDWRSYTPVHGMRCCSIGTSSPSNCR